MNKILITDTHYGIKQNSSIWLNSQIDFIYNELIPYIKTIGECAVYHLGDVFDSRSSINPMVANKVRQTFIDLSKHCKGGVYIIAGNHDYYSPIENEQNINSVDLILSNIDGVYLITKESKLITPTDLLMPWFEFYKYDTLKEKIKQHNPKNIFCHTDLLQLDNKYKNLLKNVNIYSGHIHYPFFKNNFYNLGSTYALTFADCNSERGFYELDDNNHLQFHPAKNIIKFYRFYNDDIFSIDYKSIANDYVELYINKSNLLNEEYSNRIAMISKTIHNITVIPIDENIACDTAIEFESYNIIDICKKNIPEKLYKKFNEILTN